MLIPFRPFYQHRAVIVDEIVYLNKNAIRVIPKSSISISVYHNPGPIRTDDPLRSCLHLNLFIEMFSVNRADFWRGRKLNRKIFIL